MDTWNCFALSRALRRNIRVLTSSGEVWAFTGEEYNDHAITLYLDEHIEHYEFLSGDVRKLSDSDLLLTLADRRARNAREGRLAVSQSLSRPLPLRLLGPQLAKLAQRAFRTLLRKVMVRAGRMVRSPASSCPERRASADRRSREPTMSPRARSRSRSPKRQHSGQRDVCKQLIQAPDSSTLGRRRVVHIQNRHPNVPRDRFSRPGSCDAVVEPLPPALCEWRCSECQQGIRKGPLSTKAARYGVALRHLQACWGPKKTIKQNRARLAQQSHKQGDLGGTSNLSKRKVVKQLSAEMSETSPEAHKIRSFVHPRDATPKSWSCWACESCQDVEFSPPKLVPPMSRPAPAWIQSCSQTEVVEAA